MIRRSKRRLALGGAHRMKKLLSSRPSMRGREGLLLLGLAAVPVGIELASAPESAAAASVAIAARGTAGALFLAAGLLLYVDWRVHSTPRRAWLAAAVVLMSCQLIGSAALALDPLDVERRQLGWPLVVDLAVTGAVVVLATLALEERSWRVPDPLLLGLTLGAVGTLVKPLIYSLDVALPYAPSLLVSVIVLAYGALAAVVLVRHALPGWLGERLALTLLLVSGAHLAASPRYPSTLLDLASGTLLVLAGVLWTGTSLTLVRYSLDEEHQRAMRLESSLLEIEGTDRANREAMHELKATVAGLAKASEVLSGTDLPPEVRQRVQQSMIRELARLERRLWTSETADPAVVDLDLTLDTVLDLHRARGRVFAWTPTGTSVVGRPDAIAEAVNILLDNAATHGDSTSGRVEVSLEPGDSEMVRIAVSDEGPGVPLDMRQRIFEWGERGPGSPGQGIGLNLARRLVSQEGGSLTLAEVETGSSFVIRLPAARRSEEMHGARTEHAAS